MEALKQEHECIEVWMKLIIFVGCKALVFYITPKNMKVTYNWLKEYADLNLSIEEVSQWLTDCGLEIDSVEEFESIKGGLKGLVIGKVLTCIPHPDSDHLNITTVDVGSQVLNIVCGASNVAVNQKVIVATIGAVLYSGEEAFSIKKSKIRGVESFGMICAEDEIGVGVSHDGIMVLPNDTPIGLPASEYFKVISDFVFEIGLTPNRADATSQIGAARDLVAMLRVRRNEELRLKYPSVDSFIPSSEPSPIKIKVEDVSLCPRYTGICLNNIKVEDSPAWLQDRLKSVGIRPINNVVDVTNFVMMETGQPLHAFDRKHIKGDCVVVRTAKENEKIVTLDGVERKLSAGNLLICNNEDPMCIAGVFGGEKSGVSKHTTEIFLESAYFNSVSVRKTAKEHTLNTDASFRYERGADPNITEYALKRACVLLAEVSSAKNAAAIVDNYPNPIKPVEVVFSTSRMQSLIGKNISKKEACNILEALEMEVSDGSEDNLLVKVPTNKVDVTRQADLTEEILRIYGYNNINLTERISYAPNASIATEKEKSVSLVSNLLSDNGFFEIMNNSLCKQADVESLGIKANLVPIANPLSQELNIMRPTLLLGGLYSLAFNLNHRQNNLRLYEFGRSYHSNPEADSASPVTKRFTENQHLCLFLSGMETEENWREQPQRPIDFYFLKTSVEQVLLKLRLPSSQMKISESKDQNLLYGLSYELNGKVIVSFGEVKPAITRYFDLKQTVFYADFDWDLLMKYRPTKTVVYSTISKFPSVKRDLALLVNKDVSFKQIHDSATNSEKSLLKDIRLFDVYEGKNLPENKKSYAVRFILQDQDKTLTDKQIEKCMEKITASIKQQLGAELR